jgi:hypothetical protein
MFHHTQTQKKFKGYIFISSIVNLKPWELANKYLAPIKTALPFKRGWQFLKNKGGLRFTLWGIRIIFYYY